MLGEKGYVTLGRWGSVLIRAHWTLPVGAAVFSRFEVVPGFWLGFFLLILIHEIGHAVLVRRRGFQVIAIDLHGFGGECRWRGDASSLARAQIAWGGVNAQALAFFAAIGAMAIFGEPRTPFATQLASAFTTTNAVLMGINLLPFPPLDGAEAWKLPRMLRARDKRRKPPLH